MKTTDRKNKPVHSPSVCFIQVLYYNLRDLSTVVNLNMTSIFIQAQVLSLSRFAFEVRDTDCPDIEPGNKGGLCGTKRMCIGNLIVWGRYLMIVTLFYSSLS